MDKILWIALAFVAGCLLPLQGAFNSRLGAAVGSPMHASVFSFVVGTLALAAYILVTKQTVSWTGLGHAPWWHAEGCDPVSPTFGTWLGM